MLNPGEGIKRDRIHILSTKDIKNAIKKRHFSLKPNAAVLMHLSYNKFQGTKTKVEEKETLRLCLLCPEIPSNAEILLPISCQVCYNIENILLVDSFCGQNMNSVHKSTKQDREKGSRYGSVGKPYHTGTDRFREQMYRGGGTAGEEVPDFL